MKVYKITTMILIILLSSILIFNGYSYYHDALWSEKTIEDSVLAITDVGYDQNTHSNYVTIKWFGGEPDIKLFGINDTYYFIERYRGETIHLEYIENNNEIKYLTNICYWEDPDIIDFSKMSTYYMSGTIIDVYRDYFYYGKYVSSANLHTVVVLDNITEEVDDEIISVEVHYTQTLILEYSDYDEVKKYINQAVQISFKDAFLGFGYQLQKIEVET